MGICDYKLRMLTFAVGHVCSVCIIFVKAEDVSFVHCILIQATPLKPKSHWESVPGVCSDMTHWCQTSLNLTHKRIIIDILMISGSTGYSSVQYFSGKED